MEREQMLSAWICANVMNVWTKDKITVNKLLRKGTPLNRSAASVVAEVERRQEKMREKNG